jgi:hypothetical protein
MDDRLEQDLQHIADGATPSSTAWAAIQTRIDEQADYHELEITMLKPNPKPDNTARNRVLVGAAAAALIVIGALYVALNGGDDDISLRVTETDTSVPATSAAPGTTAAPATSAATSDDGAEAATIAAAEEFIAARNAYDGETLVSLVSADASLNGLDFIDTADEYTLLADYEQALGLQISEPECSVGDPGRVSCTYQAVSTQTEALGVGPYDGRFVIVIENGLIVEVNNTIGDEAAYGAEVYAPFQSWLIANHPDDVPGLYDDTNLPVVTPETVPLWDIYSEEFATSLTGIGDVTIETTISVDFAEGERVVGTGSGTFVVTNGAGSLGCSAGTVEETYSFQLVVDKVLTCTSGPRAGTLTLNAGGNPVGNSVSDWQVSDATGDFAGITGSGPYTGRAVEQDETGSNPIYVFETVSEYTDEIVGTIQFG